MKQTCTDPVVGRILAGWRYDISGLAPEMRGDYDRHFEECEHCRARRRLHRQIDIGLIVLASLSGAFFVAALVAIKYFEPRHMWILAGIAAAGLLASALVWILVLISTPAPLVVADAALVVAARVHSRLPEEIRNKLPEDLRLKLSDQ
jgi:anti-sigma factor RsiW